jgi:5'-nucleotidase
MITNIICLLQILTRLTMHHRPNILITNDDGIYSPGIRTLYETLKNFGNVTVVAPSKEQSATSMSITIRDPLQIEKHAWESGASIYSATGTPADCVKLGMSVILKSKPDFVVSGINRGSNAGRNLLYSGTVAGAIEGVLQGVPSIAFSCHDFIDPNFHEVTDYIPKVLTHLLKHPMPNGTLLNVNFPSKAHGEIKGIKMTRQGKEMWIEDPSERLHPFGEFSYYWLGAKILECQEEDDCDVSWIKKGYAAAVPVHVGELTDHGHLNSRRSHFEEEFR